MQNRTQMWSLAGQVVASTEGNDDDEEEGVTRGEKDDEFCVGHVEFEVLLGYS